MQREGCFQDSLPPRRPVRRENLKNKIVILSEAKDLLLHRFVILRAAKDLLFLGDLGVSAVERSDTELGTVPKQYQTSPCAQPAKSGE
jgi:hypothetical protein